MNLTFKTKDLLVSLPSKEDANNFGIYAGCDIDTQGGCDVETLATSVASCTPPPPPTKQPVPPPPPPPPTQFQTCTCFDAPCMMAPDYVNDPEVSPMSQHNYTLAVLRKKLAAQLAEELA